MQITPDVTAAGTVLIFLPIPVCYRSTYYILFRLTVVNFDCKYDMKRKTSHPTDVKHSNNNKNVHKIVKTFLKNTKNVKNVQKVTHANN